jgi:hypothetical protein
MLVRVWLKSTPGMYAQYDGYVDVNIEEFDAEQAFDAAVNKLGRTSFSDRKSKMFWRFIRMEQLI